MAERVERVERELAGVALFLAEPLPLPLPLPEPLPLLLLELAVALPVAPPGVEAATESTSMASSPLTEVATDEVEEAIRKP